MTTVLKSVFRAPGTQRRMHVHTFDFDNSYQVGGEPLTAAQLGWNDVAANLTVVAFAKGGFVFEYDGANEKLLCRGLSVAGGAAAAGTDALSVKAGVLSKEAAGKATAPLREIEDTTDLSAVTGVVIFSFGKNPVAS